MNISCQRAETLISQKMRQFVIRLCCNATAVRRREPQSVPARHTLITVAAAEIYLSKAVCITQKLRSRASRKIVVRGAVIA